ncbi:MAG TPA: VOC family protein [Candidatus Binatia bacterium]|nr:VOC family protein [Candidatus Binatia bacterium]
MPRVSWTPEQIEAYEQGLKKRPHFSRMNHVSLAVRDLQISKRFYTEVLGGRIINDGTPNFAEVLVAGMIIGMSDARGRPQEADAEFPHIAFEVESDQFMPMKAWLEQHGVVTHQPWTRHHVEGLMYFKDPSGNLIEIYCPKFAGASELKLSPTPAGVVDLPSLDYTWP